MQRPRPTHKVIATLVLPVHWHHRHRISIANVELPAQASVSAPTADVTGGRQCVGHTAFVIQ
jgi:hypothetical protein